MQALLRVVKCAFKIKYSSLQSVSFLTGLIEALISSFQLACPVYSVPPNAPSGITKTPAKPDPPPRLAGNIYASPQKYSIFSLFLIK